MSALLTFQERIGTESQFLRNFMSVSVVFCATIEIFDMKKVHHGGLLRRS